MSKKKKKEAEPLLTNHDSFSYQELTKDQQKSVDLFDDWFYSKKNKKNMIFRIGGNAGTGKSVLIKHIIERYQFNMENCLVVAYTGQAVNVLRQNGVMARTIHATFMKMKEVPLYRDGKPVIFHGIPLTRPKFIPIRKLGSEVKLIICDEASFLSKDLEKLISGYNVPVVEFGDPLQLPPVGGEQCFHMNNLDYFLNQIMRQAEDSEIIKLSMAIRNYDAIHTADYGNEVKFLWAQPTLEQTFFRFKPFFAGADMILSTRNKERSEVIDLYRQYVLHTDSPFPIKGEKLICRQNDWSLSLGPYPLTNGTQGIAVNKVGMSETDPTSNTYILDFQPNFVDDEYFDGLLCDSTFLRRNYGDKDAAYMSRFNPGQKIEFAECITTHAAQGASANKVLFLDTWFRDPEYHMRIRYTAITRARQFLYYVLPYNKNYPGWTDLWRGGA